MVLAIPLFEIDGQALSALAGHPGIYALLITISTGFVLAFGLSKQLEKSFIANFLEIIGKYSYSIYLVHFPVIVLYLYQPFSGTNLQVDGTVDLAILVFIITVLSIATYHLAEIKLRKNSRIAIILLALALVVVMTSTLGNSIQRKMYSDVELKIFDAFADRSTYRCGKLFRVLNPSAITCEITMSSSKKDSSVLFVGNSHADSIKNVFADVADSMGWGLYFLTPNNPLMDGSNVSISRVLREARQHDVSHIVMHYSPNSISASVVSSLASEAEKDGIKVSFIMPVPVWKEHIPEALYYNHKNGRQLPSQTSNEYLASTNNLLDSLSKIKLPNFKVYEVYGYFCNEDCALLSDGGRPLYFDSDHLTLTGSARLSKLFGNILRDESRIK